MLIVLGEFDCCVVKKHYFFADFFAGSTFFFDASFAAGLGGAGGLGRPAKYLRVLSL
ncbi:MAG: hypothetical protein LBR07_05600 [Puniceicoccales bacterium]|nr:hypothetical protein [Puniceicoccales bacterium]